MTCFADTFYYLALLNTRDLWHARALDYSRNVRPRIFTTAWVVTELADGLADVRFRAAFLRLLDSLTSDPSTTIVPSSQTLHDAGVALYRSRPDKAWSLTDCISFVVMRQEGITDALTADHHFEQAGFVALLR